MKPLAVKDLPTENPPVTFIIPHDRGLPYNTFHACRNDTVLIIYEGPSIGHKRILGAKLAKTEWIAFLDADGVYPKDYCPKVKEIIKKLGDRFPVMMAWREHVLFHLSPRPLESGLIVRRDYFLKKTAKYPKGVKWRGKRTDIMELFPETVIVRNGPKYYHPASHDEREALRFLAFLTTLPLLI